MIALMKFEKPYMPIITHFTIESFVIPSKNRDLDLMI